MTDPKSTLLRDAARTVLMQALISEVGIQVHVQALAPMPGVTFRAKQTLYRFKQEDAAFRDLQIEFHPDDPDNRLWIINRASAPETEQ